MSTPATTTFYVTGGTLRPDAPSYVERQADKDLYAGLLRGEFCYVLTSRQMGKSSLMVHTAARLRAAGIAVAVLDLTAIGQNLSIEQWYGGLLRRIGLQLDPSGALEEALDEFWFDQEKRLGPLERWMTALQQLVLPAVGPGVQVFRGSGIQADEVTGELASAAPEPLNTRTPEHPARIVIFIDEIDAVRSLPFSMDEFFAGIRECYNRRSQDREFERLTFCLLGVASPSDLIQDTRMTPFNIGRRIELTDFSAGEAEPLAAGLSPTPPPAPPLEGEGSLVLPPSHKAVAPPSLVGKGAGGLGRALLQRILYWTGGHPYLTQRLCQAVAAANIAHPESNSQHPKSVVDQRCAALFLSPSAREKDDNLLFVRERLLRSGAELASVLELYRQVQGGRRGVDDADPLLDLLRLSGVTRLREGRLVVRNRIYAQVFDREWVTQHMPDAELRRQRAAYRRGLLRASALAATVVAAMAGLAGVALHQSMRARAAAVRTREESAQRSRLLYVADMNLIQQDWANSNLGRLRTLLRETHDNPARGFEWAYWQRLCHLDLLTLPAHTHGVFSVAYSPDGARILTAGGDGAVKLWDAGGGRELLTLQERGARVSATVFTRDGKQIVTGSLDGTVRVWDARSGRETLSFSTHGPLSLYALAVSPDGQRIVTGGSDGTAQVWLIGSGRARELLVLRGHTRPVDAVAFSPDGQRIVTGSVDKTAILWDALTGRKLRTLQGHTGPVSGVAFSPDGARLLTGSSDSTAIVWDLRAGKPLRTLRRSPMVGVAFSPDGRRIVTGNGDATATIWDAATGQALQTLKGHSQRVTRVAFSPDGRRIVTGSLDGTAKVWDAMRDRSGPAIEWHAPSLACAALSPDGRRVAAGSADGTVLLRELRTPADRVLRLKGHTDQVTAIAFSSDGRRIISGSADQTAIVWDAAGHRLRTLKAQDGAVTAVAFSPRGQRFITGTRDGTVRLWEQERSDARATGPGRALLTFQDAPRPINAAFFSPDGQRVITAEASPIAPLRVWEAATARELLTPHFTIAVQCAALSPDGRYLLTGSFWGAGNVILWEVATGRSILSFPVPASSVSAVAFSPDGRRLVTGAPDGEVSLWDAASGREILTFKAGDAAIGALAFSGDGLRLFTFSGRYENTVRIWQAASAPQNAVWEKRDRESGERRQQLEQQVGADPDYWAVAQMEDLERAADQEAAAGQPALARKERQRVGEIVRGELARPAPDPQGLLWLARNCASNNLYLPEALQAARRANALSPHDAGILDALAYVHSRMGHWDQAIENEVRAGAIDPGYLGTVFQYMAQEAKADPAAGQQRARNERRARDLVRRELARTPPSVVALNELALACATDALFLPEAVQAAERAVALSPRDDNFVDTLAEVHFRMGHVGQAIALETRALAMNSARPYYKEQLARFRNRKQQTRGATDAR